MRRFVTVIVSFFILTVLGIWTASRYQDTWEPKLRTALESQARRVLRAPVHIEHITYVFPHRVRLQNVSVEPYFDCPDITLSIDLFDIVPALIRRRPVESFGVVRVNSPHFRLTPQQIQIWKNQPKAARTSRKSDLPLFFAVTWENGTFEYGNWRLQDLQGAYRLRGPQQNFALRAQSNAAANIRLQFSTLGSRWNSQAYVQNGDIGTLIDLIQQTTRWRMPPQWTADGRLNIEAFAEGREKPVPARWVHYFKNADVSIAQAHLTIGENKMPVTAKATLLSRDNALVIDQGQLSVSDNKWTVDAQASGFGPGLQVGVKAMMPEGQLANRTVRNTSLDLQYANRLWTLTDGKASWDDGRVQATGVFRPLDMELKLTGTDLPFSELLSAQRKTPASGRLNLAAVVDGSYKEWQLRGSWWIDDLRWNRQLVSARWRGSLESQRSGAFELRGDSSDGLYHLNSRGLYRSPDFEVHSAQLQLANGETLEGEARGSFKTQRGTYTITSDRWTWGKQVFEKLRLNSQWGPNILESDATSQHRWTPESDAATLQTAFTWKPERLSIHRLTYDLPTIHFIGQGEAQLGKPTLPLLASGTLSLSDAKGGYTMPLTAKGWMKPDADWQGEAQVLTSSITARADTYYPLSTRITWNRNELHWTDLKYAGGIWTGSGHWRWEANSSACLADFAVKDASLQRWFPSSSTVSGVVQLRNNCRDLHTDGTWGPDGTFAFTMQSASGTGAGFPFHWTIQEGTIRNEAARVSIRPGSTLHFPEKKSATLQAGLEVRNLQTGMFRLFGNMDLDASWSSPAGSPVIEARARTRSLYINDYELEEGQILARYQDGIIRFIPPPIPPTLISGTVHIARRPQLVFDHFIVTGKDQQKLDLHGEVGPTLWNFALTGQRMDLGVLGELAGFTVPFHGSADLAVKGTGDRQRPHLQGNVRLHEGRISVFGFSEGDADFLWQDNRISFKRLRLADKGRYTAIGSGVFPIQSRTARGPQEPMNFSVRLENSNLALLQSMFPEIRKARGDVEGLVQLKGTWENPEMSGRIRIEDGDITGAHYFRRLSNIQMQVDLDGSALKITELRGHSGDGDIEASGEVRLSGFEPAYYDLQAKVTSRKGIELQVPELAIPDSPLAKQFRFLTSATRCDVLGNIELQGPADQPTFRGELTLSKGHFTFPPPQKKPAPPAWTAWIQRTFWDIGLRFRDGLWFENELVQANMAGQIHIRGTGDQLKADGETVISDGRISYLGLQFDIREANFDLKNNTGYIRALAESKIEAVDTVSLTPTADRSQRISFEDTITLTIDYAPLDQIKPRLTSATNPSLSQEKLLARVTRLEMENLSPEERNYIYQRQIVSLIDNSLATPFAQNVLKRTGLVDRVRVQRIFDPNAAPLDDPTNPEARNTSAGYDILANTKYTVEKNLMNRLAVGYGVRFVPTVSAETNQRTLDLVSDLQMSYQAFKNVYVRGAFDLPNADNPAFVPDKRVTIEPRWRFGWWGNTNKEKLKKKEEQKK